MKKTVAAALVLALLAGTASYAQSGQAAPESQSDKQKRDDKAPRAQKPDAGAKAQNKAQNKAEKANKAPDRPKGEARPNGEARKAQDRNPDRPASRQQPDAGRDRPNQPDVRRPAARPDVVKQRTVIKRPGEGSALRNRDQGRLSFDQSRWRPVYVSPRKFRIAAYRRPSGWYAHSWSRGAYLPRAWFVTSYYLNRASYGLPYPPIGCEWIRVGEDALLVDIWTGRVLSVYRNVFW